MDTVDQRRHDKDEAERQSGVQFQSSKIMPIIAAINKGNVWQRAPAINSQGRLLCVLDEPGSFTLQLLVHLSV